MPFGRFRPAGLETIFARSTLLMRRLSFLVIAAFVVSLGACDESDDGAYLEFVGGGFMFNYRLAEAFYGFVARPLREIPEGTIIEAQFEDPSGGAPLVVTQIAKDYRQEFSFHSPPVKGVVAGRDYKVELRLLSAGDRKLLASYSTSFRSSADQAVLPDAPTVVGPGYLRNPEATEKPQPPGG